MLCLLYKLFAAPYTVLIVKSRISDGRLRVSYGYRRDNIENSSLARFEDERMNKFLSTFKNRRFNVTDESVTTEGVENYRNITGGSENDDYRSEEKSDFEYTDDDVSKVTFNSTINGNDNASLMTRIKTKFKSREPNYAGRKVRVVPTSPFLQLSRVHEMEEIQRVVPPAPAPPLYRKALVPLPLAIQLQIHQQKFLNGSLSNKPDHHAAQAGVTQSNFPEIHEERSPVLYLDNGTISPYQPGLVSQAQLEHFTQSVDVDYQDEGYVPPDSEGVYKNNTGVAMVPAGSHYFNKTIFVLQINLLFSLMFLQMRMFFPMLRWTRTRKPCTPPPRIKAMLPNMLHNTTLTAATRTRTPSRNPPRRIFYLAPDPTDSPQQPLARQKTPLQRMPPWKKNFNYWNIQVSTSRGTSSHRSFWNMSGRVSSRSCCPRCF